MYVNVCTIIKFDTVYVLMMSIFFMEGKHKTSHSLENRVQNCIFHHRSNIKIPL